VLPCLGGHRLRRAAGCARLEFGAGTRRRGVRSRAPVPPPVHTRCPTRPPPPTTGTGAAPILPRVRGGCGWQRRGGDDKTDAIQLVERQPSVTSFNATRHDGEKGIPMAETLKTVRNLKLFNRLNKCIKQGITDLQNKDHDSATNYFNMAIKTAKSLEGIAEDPFREHFSNIITGLNQYQDSKNEDVLVSTNPSSVHSQLWAVHKKICDAFSIPYEEDVDAMEDAINKLAEEGVIS
jgi:hypothetical protein